MHTKSVENHESRQLTILTIAIYIKHRGSLCTPHDQRRVNVILRLIFNEIVPTELLVTCFRFWRAQVKLF